MRIFSHVGFLAIWGRQLRPNVLDAEDGPTCGGGEEAGLRTASEMVKLGHEVELWWYGQSGEWGGVQFHDLHDPFYPRLTSERWDAVLGWSNLAALEWARNGPNKTAVRLFCQQLNDLSLPGDWTKVDCIISPSQSHSDEVVKWGWSGKRAVVHNGIVPGDYADSTPWHERPLTVGYWSSPDRGLHHLLRAWPRVRGAIPEAKLHVFYEIDRYLAMLMDRPVGFYGERGTTLARLIVKAKADKSIVFEGQRTRKYLAKFQKNCRVQCYPLDLFGYCEGYCTSVNQGLAAGCTVIVTPQDALPSLYGDGPIWFNEKDPIDIDFHDHVADMTIKALRNELPRQDLLRARGRLTASRYAWSNAGQQMERACKRDGWL